MLEQITFPVGPLACNCTILGDAPSATAVVIDPGAQVDGILLRLAQRHWRLTDIIITHAHIDHIGGAGELKRVTGARVWMNPRDRQLHQSIESQAHWLGMPIPEPVTIDASLDDSFDLKLSGTRLEILETPGHTQGSVCLYIPSQGKLFAGDTLFAGSVGRTDLPGGDDRAIIDSIRTRLLPLPDTTVVIPGHGPFTTIGRERGSNPFLNTNPKPAQ